MSSQEKNYFVIQCWHLNWHELSVIKQQVYIYDKINPYVCLVNLVIEKSYILV